MLLIIPNIFIFVIVKHMYIVIAYVAENETINFSEETYQQVKKNKKIIWGTFYEVGVIERDNL